MLETEGNAMIRADEDAVREALGSYHNAIFEIAHDAWRDWQTLALSGRLLFPSRSRACLVHDFMVQRAIAAWAGNSGVRILQYDETAKFVIDDAILLRFKKADDRGLGANIPTQAFLDFAEQQRDLPGMPYVHKVEVVYVLNRLQTQIDRVVVVARDGNVRLWDYVVVPDTSAEIVPLPIQPIAPDQERGARITVKKPAANDDKNSEVQ